MTIYFTRYDRRKLIRMLSLHYRELIGKTKKHQQKKYMMVDYYILRKVSSKIKEIISIEKFGDTKILVVADDRFPDNSTLKNVVILIICVIKDGDKFYPQIF